jgi:hypothetical protein
MKLSVLLCFIPSLALAHHGQDFFVTLDSEVPAVYSATTFTSFEWSRSGTTDELSFEPGFLVGIAPGLAAGMSVSLEDDGGGNWNYSGITPQVQFQIPTGDFPVSFGISASYSFADGAAGHEHGAAGHSHGEGDDDEDLDLGPDAPPADSDDDHDHGHSHSEHSHDGIHRHGEDYFQLRFVAEAALDDKTRLVGNLIGVATDSGEIDLGYALGIRRQIHHDFALGLEATGDFDRHGEHEVIGGVYWSPTHTCVIRLGVGAGIGAVASDFSVHSGVTWRF